MAIVDWREVPTFSEFEILRDAFTALGVPTVVCDPRDLIFEPAGAGPRVSEAGLYAHGQRIDLVYRRVLINDMLAREAECRVLLDAYEARAVCVANSLRCKIPHKKAFFAVLTDERHARLFSPEERELIRQHIPWTAIVEDGPVLRDGKTIDLLAHLRAHRDQYVIKPNDEYGGTGVTLGWETSEAAWDAALDARRGRTRSRLGGAGAHRGPARGVSGLRGRRRRDARHAGGFRAVRFSWPPRRVPDAPERDRARQRDVRRRTGACIRGQ